jgi:hypothetical protein
MFSILDSESMSLILSERLIKNSEMFRICRSYYDIYQRKKESQHFFGLDLNTRQKLNFYFQNEYRSVSNMVLQYSIVQYIQ